MSFVVIVAVVGLAVEVAEVLDGAGLLVGIAELVAELEEDGDEVIGEVDVVPWVLPVGWGEGDVSGSLSAQATSKEAAKQM